MRIFLIAPAAALVASPVWAAETADPNPTIIVTARVEADEAQSQVEKTPGGADVVRHEDYADKSLVSLRDTLAFSPGVYAQPRFGQEVRISIRGSGLSRGFHMRGLTLLQDGVPINLADDNGDFQELEPIFFDHLEVYRGSNALRFGSGTLGGAINGVTPTGRTAPGLYARLDAGTFDTARLLVSGGFASNGFEGWLGISGDTSDGDRDHAKRKSFRAHGNLGVRLTDRVTTRIYASYNAIDQELPGALDRATVRSRPKTGNFIGDQARNIDSVRLQNRTSFDFGRVTLQASAFYNNKSLYHPIFQVVDQRSDDWGAYFRAEYASPLVEVTLGGESRWGTIDSRRYLNLDGERGALTFRAQQRARTSSLYGEARLRPLAGLTLVAGAVYQDGFRRQHQHFNSAMGGPSDVVGSARFHEFSPKLGLLYQPSAHVQLYANVSRSAEMPTFIELAQVASFVPVEAQHGWTVEFGSRGRAGIASWDVTFYRSALKGEMLQFAVGPDIPATTFNADRTLHQGIEAALSLDLRPWLRLRQVYQFAEFRFRRDSQFGNNRLPVIPPHSYRAELRIGGDALHIAPSVEWVPQGAFADYANTIRTGGYALVGITAGATVMPGIDLFLDARNLTGRKAIGDVSAVVLASPASAIYYPVERRAVTTGIRARF